MTRDRPPNEPLERTPLGGRLGDFSFQGRRLGYEAYGQGDRVLVLIHGLLLDNHLNRGIAAGLAARGHHVVLLNLLGHGDSDKPIHASEYRMDVYSRQLIALLDHLELEQAVIGGVSLGANVSLLAAASWPNRVRGLVIEMPVLERAVPVAAMTFVPLLVLVRYTGVVARGVAGLFRRAPRTGTAIDSLLNAMSLEPRVVASIVHGILVGPVAPTMDQRKAMSAPTVVIGHGWDLIHPFDDAANLARQLPNARLVPAHWPLEMRLRPRRLVREVADFLDEVWATSTADRGPIRTQAVPA